MFSLYSTEIRNYVWLDKKEDFAVPGINYIFARRILIYARKKDVKYTIMSPKWILIYKNGLIFVDIYLVIIGMV